MKIEFSTATAADELYCWKARKKISLVIGCCCITFFTPHNTAQHLFFESESESMMEVKTISELSNEGENEIMKF